MIHIKWFDSDSDFQDAYYGGQLGGSEVKEGDPWLSWNDEIGGLAGMKYNKSQLDPYCIPLTFKALQNNSKIDYIFTGPTDEYIRGIRYSINGGTWNYVEIGDSGDTSEMYTFPTLNEGDIISFVGDNNAYTYCDESSNEWIWQLCANTGRFNVYGNIMSMMDSVDFINTPSFDNSWQDNQYEFYYFFHGSTAIVDASNLILPSTTINPRSYCEMFSNCTNLLYPPKILPSLSISEYGYAYMFYGCTKMKSAPRIMANNMGPSACASMFSMCSALVEVQDQLYATTLFSNCCTSMFNSCTSLVVAPNLPATTLANYCYSTMFSGCTSLVVAPNLPATTLANYCYFRMFKNCISLERAPILPATTLANGSIYDTYCYSEIFYGCSSLHYIRCLAVLYVRSNTNLANWINGVADEGVIEYDEDGEWPAACIPDNWVEVYIQQ